jgi:hypothetical protein
VANALDIHAWRAPAQILLIEAEAATARTLALREPVDRTNQGFGNVSPPLGETFAAAVAPGIAAGADGCFRQTGDEKQI